MKSTGIGRGHNQLRGPRVYVVTPPTGHAAAFGSLGAARYYCLKHGGSVDACVRRFIVRS